VQEPTGGADRGRCLSDGLAVRRALDRGSAVCTKWSTSLEVSGGSLLSAGSIRVPGSIPMSRARLTWATEALLCAWGGTASEGPSGHRPRRRAAPPHPVAHTHQIESGLAARTALPVSQRLFECGPEWR
jgi:hypothetical protein